MRKYWLYIESFTFIFHGRQGYLIFNAISNQSFLVSPKEKVCAIIEQLLDPQQMYSVEVSEIDIRRYQMLSFIKSLKGTFTGDLIGTERIKKKPIALYPKPSIMMSTERLKVHPERSVGQNLLNYLHELNIYITGDCRRDCNSCNIYNKQVTTCIKSSAELNILVLKELLHNARSTNLYRINVLGGDIFNYTHWKELCILINDIPFQTKLYNHFQNILQNSGKIKDLPRKSTFCVVIPDSFSKKELDKILKLLEINDVKFELGFHITSVLQYSDAVSFCKKRGVTQYSILPVFNSTNAVFFQNHVYLDNDSIFSVSQSKKEIFSRMALNINDFGKLNILSNGDIYANINFPKLGNISNSSLYEILYTELVDGKSWLRIRNQETCNQCVYQWLCPSPSDYEIAIRKPNLCHIWNE